MSSDTIMGGDAESLKEMMHNLETGRELCLFNTSFAIIMKTGQKIVHFHLEDKEHNQYVASHDISVFFELFKVYEHAKPRLEYTLMGNP